MKHAILIMAHKNVQQISRLVKSVATPDMDVFIHLDLKMPVTDTDLKLIKGNNLNVYFTEHRISGELDKWSLPQIVLNLINKAYDIEKEENIEYKYFILLSGQDYPIRNINEIYNFLCESYPKPFIDCNPYAENTWLSSKFLEYKYLHKIEKLHETYKSGFIRKCLVLPIVVGDKISKMLKTSPYKRLTKLGCKLYGGSTWWILPRPAIEYIFKQVNLNTKIVKELKKTWTPDETFFQIMTMASPLCDMVDINPINSGKQNCLTYANFTTPKKGFTGHPHALLKEDYERLMENSKTYLFARKFDSDVDSGILDLIDKKIS